MAVLVKSRAEKMRLVLIECGSPQDTMAGHLESPVVVSAAKLAGHEVLSHDAISVRAFREKCNYIASIRRAPDWRSAAPLCLHLASHGSDDGLLFGGDVSWDDLFEIIEPVLTVEYPGPRLISLSACHADQQKLTDRISRAFKAGAMLQPPRYVFGTADEPSCCNAAMAWTLLYHRADSLMLRDKEQVQRVLDSIRQMELPSIVYWRWDIASKRYLRYSGKAAVAA